jgi:hypothetical protein
MAITRYYLLNGQNPVRCSSLDQLLKHGSAGFRTSLIWLYGGRCSITTIFRGIDQCERESDPPTLFETTTWWEGESARTILGCSTAEEARKQHMEAVARAQQLGVLLSYAWRRACASGDAARERVRPLWSEWTGESKRVHALRSELKAAQTSRDCICESWNRESARHSRDLNRVLAERDALLKVRTRDGLSASEWILRTAAAEQRAERVEALYRDVAKLCEREWASYREGMKAMEQRTQAAEADRERINLLEASIVSVVSFGIEGRLGDLLLYRDPRHTGSSLREYIDSIRVETKFADALRAEAAHA